MRVIHSYSSHPSIRRVVCLLLHESRSSLRLRRLNSARETAMSLPSILPRTICCPLIALAVSAMHAVIVLQR